MLSKEFAYNIKVSDQTGMKIKILCLVKGLTVKKLIESSVEDMFQVAKIDHPGIDIIYSEMVSKE